MAAPVIRCRACEHEASTWDLRCPACRTPYNRRLPWLTNRMRWGLAVLAIVGTGGAIAYAAPRIDATREEQAAKDARERADHEARERARVAADQRPVRGRLAGVTLEDPAAPAGERRAARRVVLAAFEDALLADARGRVARGEIEGSVSDVICRPLLHTHGGKGEELDLDRPIGRYECLASGGDIHQYGRRVARIGQPYVGTVDFRRGAYALCRYHPPPGEGGVMLAQVPLDPSCMGASSRAELRALGIYENPRD